MKTKIVFMGTPAFSVPILEGLLASGYEVSAVVTQPDKPVGRKKVMTPPPVKEAALKHNIQVLQPEKISGSKEMETIIDMQPDLIVTAAFGQFLPKKLLDAPKFGAVNVHASLLPKYRGGAPVHYAVMNGEKETGVTIMFMEKKMDAGDILSQKTLEITRDDDVGTLFERLSSLGKELLLDTLPNLLDGKITPIKQDESMATYSPNIKREEEIVNWSKTAEEIDNQIRGMRPWPGAYTLLDGKRLKLWGATPLNQKTEADPGTIIQVDKDFLHIACGNGTVLRLDEVQPAGKSTMTTKAFLSGVGSHLSPGDKVGTNGK